MRTKKLESPSRAMLPESSDPETALAIANLAMNPSVSAAAVISQYNYSSQILDIKSVSETLAKTINTTVNGDMKNCEAMLLSQAQALEAIFVNLSCRAIQQDMTAKLELYLRLALKAQNQCRNTLEALARIKNPSVIYTHQANIAHGHQQVNNREDNLQSKNFSSNELMEEL